MATLLNREVIVTRWVTNVSTPHGDGRYSLEVIFSGAKYKLIVNAIDIKLLIDDMARNHVTSFKTMFYDKGGMKYSYSEDATEILTVNNREIIEVNGVICYKDNNEKVQFS